MKCDGYDDETIDTSVSILDRAWDASNHELHYYRAICSPAYLIMTFDDGLEGNLGSLYGNVFDHVLLLQKFQNFFLADNETKSQNFVFWLTMRIK